MTLKVVFLPAATVAGTLRPLIVKPVPEITAEFTTRFEFPPFVIVTLCVLDCPTCTLLKFNVAGDICMTASVPVPLNETERGEFEASLVTVSVPVEAASDVGANCTCTDALCPTGIDTAPLPLITVNPAPEIVADAILTVAVPVLFTVRV